MPSQELSPICLCLLGTESLCHVCPSLGPPPVPEGEEMDRSQPSSLTNLLKTPEDETKQTPVANGYTSNGSATDTDTEPDHRSPKHYRVASIGSSDVSYSEHQTSTVIRVTADDAVSSDAPGLQAKERRNALGRMNAPTPPISILSAGLMPPRAASPYGAIVSDEDSTINYHRGSPQRSHSAHKPMRKTISGKSVVMVYFPC